MGVSSFHRRRPVAVLTTVAFLVACLATAAYAAGIVSGIPKTLPVFTRLVTVTAVSLAVTILAWLFSLLE